MGSVDFLSRQQYTAYRKKSVRLFIAICFITAIYTLHLSYNTKNEEKFEEINPSTVAINIGNDIRYTDTYRKKEKLPKDFKYILLWTQPDYAPLYFFKKGQIAFIENNCPHINCYVTSDRDFLDYDVTKFDVIAFNGRNLDGMQIPEARSPKQRYIYFNMESSDNHPVCNKNFDGFFNWTATYRLDSDIPMPYLDIRDKNNNIIGPKRDMNWEKIGTKFFDSDLYERWRNKTKAAAWFVSACASRSNRTGLATELQKAMLPYDMELYIYGKCGKFECPRHKHADCAKMLESDFYFYLSFENSFADDYVTEKLLTAVQHDTVPIVFGGADYSRFLPPDSYLNANELTPDELAAEMFSIINSPRLFQKYFKWRQYYKYFNRINGKSSLNVCTLCAALNNETIINKSRVYTSFREWWNPHYRDRC